MSGPESPARSLLPGRRIIIQLVGFVVGIALLVLCIQRATGDGSDAWSQLRDASPWLLLAMFGCSIASGVINAFTFWITIRPVQRIRALDLVLINFGAKLLNYAPVRLGAIGRVWYHAKIDRLPLVLIGGWFAFIAYVLVLGVVASVVATVAYGAIDLVWFALVVGMMLFGTLVIRFMKGSRLLERHGRGIERIVASPSALLGTVVLRILDLAAYALRLGIAAHLLGLSLDASDVVILAVVTLASDLSPVGRVGIREFAVALAATHLGMNADEAAGSMESLALLDSAAEAIAFGIIGAPALIWLFWRHGRNRPTASASDDATADSAPARRHPLIAREKPSREGRAFRRMAIAAVRGLYRRVRAPCVVAHALTYATAVPPPMRGKKRP